MEEKLLAPCGLYCGTCEFLNRKEKPSCSGCNNQSGHPFWGECWLYVCATNHKVEHCGLCRKFPCDLFIDHFDPEDPLGQKSAIMRAGLLAYRNKAGTEKYLKLVKKLKDQKEKP